MRTYLDMVAQLIPVHVGDDGEIHNGRGNASSCIRRDGRGLMLLIDIDDAMYVPRDGVWRVLPHEPIPGMPYRMTIRELFEASGVLDTDGTFLVDHVVVPSTTSGHAHVYIDVAWSFDQIVLITAAMTSVGLQGRGNFESLVKRGMSILFYPGVKPTLPKKLGSSSKKRSPNVHIIPMRKDWPAQPLGQTIIVEPTRRPRFYTLRYALSVAYAAFKHAMGGRNA